MTGSAPDPTRASPAVSVTIGTGGDVQADARLTLFHDRAQSLGVNVLRVRTGTDAAAAIDGLTREGDHRSVIISSEVMRTAPEVADALTGAGITVEPASDPTATRDAPLGVSWATVAIAETGSVLLAEDTLADRAIGMLVATQVVVCPVAGLRATLEDAADALRALAVQPGGSYATLVTGPSRTADIERVLTVGVQGPSRLIVIFIDDLGSRSPSSVA